MAQLHPLERRAALLSARLTQRIGDLSQSLTAAQGRVPFKTQLGQARALDWWAEHRYDGLGAAALKTLDPLSIARLDSALTTYTQNKQAAGLPNLTDPTTNPTQTESDPTAMAAGVGPGSGLPHG